MGTNTYQYLHDQACKDHLLHECKNCQIFHLNYHDFITILTKQNFTTNAEFNGLSSVIYRNRILQSQLKIFTKYNLVCNLCSYGCFVQARLHITNADDNSDMEKIYKQWHGLGGYC